MRGNDKVVSMILAKIKPKTGVSVGLENDSGEMDREEELHGIAEELVEAVRCGDTRGVVDALRGAFLYFDSEPHVEGKHISESAEEDEPEEGDKELFEKYFGGGPVRYAMGGMTKYAEGGVVEDEDESLLKSFLEGAPETYAQIKSDPAAFSVFKQMNKNAATDSEVEELESMMKTPGSDFWKQASIERQKMGTAAPGIKKVTEIKDKPRNTTYLTDNPAKVHKKISSDRRSLDKRSKYYDGGVVEDEDDSLLKSFLEGAPETYAQIRSDPAAFSVFKQMNKNAATDSEVEELESMMKTPGSEFWKQAGVERQKMGATAPGIKKVTEIKDKPRNVTYLTDNPAKVRSKMAKEIQKKR